MIIILYYPGASNRITRDLKNKKGNIRRKSEGNERQNNKRNALLLDLKVEKEVHSQE